MQSLCDEFSLCEVSCPFLHESFVKACCARLAFLRIVRNKELYSHLSSSLLLFVQHSHHTICTFIQSTRFLRQGAREKYLHTLLAHTHIHTSTPPDAAHAATAAVSRPINNVFVTTTLETRVVRKENGTNRGRWPFRPTPRPATCKIHHSTPSPVWEEDEPSRTVAPLPTPSETSCAPRSPSARIARE